jgi:hypothetical protein
LRAVLHFVVRMWWAAAAHPTDAPLAIENPHVHATLASENLHLDAKLADEVR